MLFVSLSLACFAQGPKQNEITCPQKTTAFTASSGVPLTIPNDCGGVLAGFAYTITGSPASMSVVLTGTITGAPAVTLNTYTGTTSTVVTPSFTTPYDYFAVTATWTGGTNVVFTVKGIASSAANQGGSSLTGTSPIVVSSGTISCPTCGIGTGNVNSTGTYVVNDAAGFGNTAGTSLVDLGTPWTNGTNIASGTVAASHVGQFNLAGTGNGGVGGTLPAADVGQISLGSTGNGGVGGTLPEGNVGTGYPYSSLSGSPSIPAASTTTPNMDSTGAVGVSTNYARADHTHPSDTSRVPTSTTINTHALTGNVTLASSDIGLPNFSESGGLGQYIGASGFDTTGPLDASGGLSSNGSPGAGRFYCSNGVDPYPVSGDLFEWICNDQAGTQYQVMLPGAAATGFYYATKVTPATAGTITVGSGVITAIALGSGGTYPSGMYPGSGTGPACSITATYTSTTPPTCTTTMNSGGTAVASFTVSYGGSGVTGTPTAATPNQMYLAYVAGSGNSSIPATANSNLTSSSSGDNVTVDINGNVQDSGVPPTTITGASADGVVYAAAAHSLNSTSVGALDNVLQGQGSGNPPAFTSVPSCLDTTGNHLNYSTSTHLFICGTSVASAVVQTGQTNSYGAFLQQFASATMGLPSSPGYAPTTAALFGYDSTNNRLVVGNGTNTNFTPWFTGTPTTQAFPCYSGTIGLVTNCSLTDTGTLVVTTEGFKAPSYTIGSNLWEKNTAPTISSGFGTSPSIASNNGTVAFTINVGTGGTASSGVVGLPTAANGWVGHCDDITTQSTSVFITKQTAGSTTSITFTQYNDVAVATAWAASDILWCMAVAR
jgi:hypothetical protein